MRIIGITGGVGAGKSLILNYMEEKYHAFVLYADRVANELKMPGQACYQPLIHLMGPEICMEDGTIDKVKMADKIFSDRELLDQINGIVHPAVKDYICKQIEKKKRQGEVKLFIIEAALLIEDHYDEICDEIWYIYADLQTRTERLVESRGYTKERIKGIVNGQLSDDMFRQACQFVIDNSGSLEKTYLQIDEKLGAYEWQI